MHFTGIAGEVLGFLVLCVAYAIILTGLFWTVYYILIEILLRKCAEAVGVYKVLVQFIIYRREFLKWLKNRNE